MASFIDELKQRARLLQRDVQMGDPAALARVRVLRELKQLSPGQTVEATRHRHCLAVLARELGLNGWSHLTELWSCSEAADFGTLFYPPSCGGHWNIWCSAYEEAREIRAQHGGYLLPYRHQLLIVDRYFIDDLGLDPDDADWAKIERDWIRPADGAARQRLCQAALRARSRNTAPDRPTRC